MAWVLVAVLHGVTQQKLAPSGLTYVGVLRDLERIRPIGLGGSPAGSLLGWIRQRAVRRDDRASVAPDSRGASRQDIHPAATSYPHIRRDVAATSPVRLRRDLRSSLSQRLSGCMYIGCRASTLRAEPNALICC
jgi:hypothetical protein